MPPKLANLRDPYKIRFSVFLEKSKHVVNPMVWRCREFFFSKMFNYFDFFLTRCFSIFILLVIFVFLKKLIVAKNYNIFFRA